MDVALASVLSSAVVGLAGLGTAVYGIRVGRRQAREDRVEGRRADAYLELLTLVEAEGQWVETRLESLLVESTYSAGDIRPPLADRPSPIEKGRARVIVFAYGSKQIQDLWSAWIAAVQAIDEENQNLAYAQANPANQGHIEYGDLKKLDQILVPQEQGRRLELLAAASLELNYGGSDLYWKQHLPPATLWQQLTGGALFRREPRDRGDPPG